MEVEYEYPAASAGRVSVMRNSLSGEEVEYQYDSLNRLVAASTTAGSSKEWGLAFGYDGFGNRVTAIWFGLGVQFNFTPSGDWLFGPAIGTPQISVDVTNTIAITPKVPLP